jgi:mannose-1-phosphate guanylyltransferase
MQPWQDVFAVLLAGGRGTRFWPLSREEHPKQLLQLFSGRSLVEETYARIRPVVPRENILVATTSLLVTRLQQMFSDIPLENFISEPLPRNTAPCIALACARLLAKNKDSILIALPSDHYVVDTNAFLEIIESAVYYARKGYIVTLGVTPTHPETGYGYIKFGEFEHEATENKEEPKHRARKILEFVEKPDFDRAVAYLKAGRYLWNSGIFVFRCEQMMEKIKIHLPGLADLVEEVVRLEALGAPSDALLTTWAKMPDISIDYGVMEKAQGLVVVPASFGWSDVGSWRALRSFPTDDKGNFVRGRVVSLDSSGNVLYCTAGILCTVGCKDMVVVVTKGACLVCPVERTQDVKALVEELRRRGFTEYL